MRRPGDTTAARGTNPACRACRISDSVYTAAVRSNSWRISLSPLPNFWLHTIRGGGFLRDVEMCYGPPMQPDIHLGLTDGKGLLGALGASAGPTVVGSTAQLGNSAACIAEGNLGTSAVGGSVFPLNPRHDATIRVAAGLAKEGLRIPLPFGGAPPQHVEDATACWPDLTGLRGLEPGRSGR